MKFSHESLQDDFHQAKTWLQLVCSALESECFLFGKEPELISMGEHQVTLLLELDLEKTDHIIQKINQMFPRKYSDTAVLLKHQEGICMVELTATTPEDLNLS